jgi:hypothetical protein
LNAIGEGETSNNHKQHKAMEAEICSQYLVIGGIAGEA